jgi:predicted secreted Zn-dependent protease
VIEKWRNLAEAMTKHEGEHAQNARDAANETVALIRVRSSDASCEKLSAYLQAKGAEITRRKNDANAELDARTQHGALERVTLSW